jgi:glycerol kinase
MFIFIKINIFMQTYLMAIDQGTTSCRAILFDYNGNIISVAQQEFEQIFPNPGWVEHNATEIWETQLLVCKKVLEQTKTNASQIHAIGITNQRETVVLWDKNTGQPIYNAIVWQDRRTSDYCNSLKEKGLANTIQQKTGLIIDAYFSGTKIKWILDNVPNARIKAANGELLAGTMDCWLLWKLTDGAIHQTDVSNASRTMVYNINTLEWDDNLLELMDIPKSILPKVCSSSEVYGSTTQFGESIKIAGIAGDQQAALFGQMCTTPGMVKNTYGTGCFMLMHTGVKPMFSKNNLLTTIAWQINGVTEYALEGSVFIAGAVVQWLRDSLGIIEKSNEVEALVQKATTNDGVYFVPAFAGLGTPHWNQEARGTIIGLTRGTGAAHIARAAIESIAYQVRDVLVAMQHDANINIAELRVDGGATVNDMLMQFQSDILHTKVTRPQITETTALGAAYLAGLATGFWANMESIQTQWQINKTFTPTMQEEEKNKLLKGWNNAIKTTLYQTQ